MIIMHKYRQTLPDNEQMASKQPKWPNEINHGQSLHWSIATIQFM